MIYKMTLADTSDTMTFDLLEVPIADKDVEGAVDNTLVNGNVFTDYLWLKKQFIQKWSIMCPDEYDRLRGFYTRQWSNATVPTYYLFYGVDLSEKFSLTLGDYQLVTNDTQYDAPLSLDKLYGNTTQNGSPTPDAPIPVETVTGTQTVQLVGNNLMNPNTAPITASSGTSSSAIQDGIRVTYGTGSTTTNARFVGIVVGDASHFVGKNIVARANMVASASNAPRLAIGLCKSDGSDRLTKVMLDQSGSTYYTITSGDVASRPYFYIYLYANLAGGTVSAGDYIDYTNLQIEISDSTTPTAYEPYQTRTHEINLGKNLCPDLDGFVFTNNGSATNTKSENKIVVATSDSSNASGVYISYSNATNTSLCPEMFQSGYVFSCTASASASSTLRIGTNTGTQVDISIGTTASRISVEISGNQSFIFYNRSQNNATITLSDFQVEVGSVATSYAPYFTPIELCKIGSYQDYIWNDNGTWKIRKNVGKITFTGSADESWAISQTGTANYFYRYREIADYAGTQDINILAFNNLASTAVISSNNTNQGFMILNTSSSYQDLRFRYGTEKTLADWKTFLGNNNMRVYYASDAPTDTPITNTALLAQLEALQETYLYVGKNNLYLTPSGGAQGSADFTYEKIYSKTTPVIPTTAVRLTLTDDGVINPCGCRRNVQLKMRETAQ